MFDINPEWYGRCAVKHFQSGLKATVQEILGDAIHWKITSMGEPVAQGRSPHKFEDVLAVVIKTEETIRYDYVI